MKNLMLFASFFFVTANLFGQAGLDSIYTLSQKNLDVVYVMNKYKINRIVFSGGQVQKFVFEGD